MQVLFSALAIGHHHGASTDEFAIQNKMLPRISES